MGDGLSGLLPYLQNIPLGVVVVILLRLWTRAVKDVRDERADHRRTQDELDAERESRRKVEDKVDVMARDIRGLTAEVARLRNQIGEP